MTDQERIDDIIEAQDSGYLKMTEWEESFIDDISIKLSEGKKLKWGIVKKLIEIWEKIN